ncbi:glycosyltransferase family 2 protein [Candidatus Pacearchaeota archaeon]|nr:glycosyltransferase family 2 protein [Candidatus Pacearchaeota archaeon]
MKKAPEISIILPCRNEEQALPFCLSKIKEIIKKYRLDAEIIVSDSSIDESPKIAKREKVRLIKHDKEGYGIAYLEAFEKARGRYIFMTDADGTYDFEKIPYFLKYLKEGYDLVMGNRFAGHIEKGAMPLTHRYIGTPLLSSMLRIFFGKNIKDSQSGMRAISKEALKKLDLKTTGMEFASEMIIKSIKNNLKIKEIPIDYYKRKGKSKLRPFSDAWKHTRFMLLYSPLFLFFIPGLILFLTGFLFLLWFYLGAPEVWGIKLYFHPMFLFSVLTIIGYQLIIFTIFAKSYAINHLGEKSYIMDNLYKYITIEKAGITGIFISFIGAIIYVSILINWIKSGFGSLNEIKNSIIALTFIILGIQTIFSSFMMSILSIKGN